MARAARAETGKGSETGYTMHDDDVSSHRTRTNRRHDPPAQQPSEALTQAVNAVYDALEDRG